MLNIKKAYLHSSSFMKNRDKDKEPTEFYDYNSSKKDQK
jgi:hypothetical protein